MHNRSNIFIQFCFHSWPDCIFISLIRRSFYPWPWYQGTFRKADKLSSSGIASEIWFCLYSCFYLDRDLFSVMEPTQKLNFALHICSKGHNHVSTVSIDWVASCTSKKELPSQVLLFLCGMWLLLLLLICNQITNLSFNTFNHLCPSDIF